MALPGLVVEVALELAAGAVPGDGDWTDLSDRVLSFDMKRGREDRTATFEPGTVSLTLDNADDLLDPLQVGSLVELDAGKGLPLSPIRIQVDYDGDLYPLFYGYIGPECWIVSRNRVDAGSTVQLDAVDRMALFAQTGLPSSLFAAQVQWLRPSWWVRGIGGDVASGNGDALRDSSGNGYAGEIAASGSNVIFETASLVEGDSDSAMLHQAGVSGFTDEGNLTVARSHMTMACVWQGDPDGVDQEIMRQRDMSSTRVRWRVECQTSGAIVAIVYNTSGTATDFVAAPANPSSASGGRWDDGAPHLIFCRVEGGSRLRIWVDGKRDEATASIPATIAGRVIFGGGSQNAHFDEVAYWENALTTAEINSITDAFTGVAPFAGDTYEERLVRWLDLAGVSVIPAMNVATPGAMLGVSSMPSTCADALQETADSFRGSYYVDRSGGLVARDSEVATSAVSDNYYTDPTTTLSDSAAAIALFPPAFPGDPYAIPRTRPQFHGTRLDRVVNVSRVTWNGLTFSMRNDASVTCYGARIREWTCDQQSVYDAVASADDEVNGTQNYAAPVFEVQPVTIYPLVDDGALYFAVLHLELERAVALRWETASGDVAVSTLNIQGESWSWRQGTDLTVELALAGIYAPTIAWS